MKAITICQPYAHLIALPDTDLQVKRVENRKWPTSHRGPILIHAGKSRDWLELDDDGLADEEYGFEIADMAFGAIVALAELVECFQMRQTMLSGVTRASCIPGPALARWPWLATHSHAEGPFCWVLQNVRPLNSPVKCSGAQGLWMAPPQIVDRVMEQL